MNKMIIKRSNCHVWNSITHSGLKIILLSINHTEDFFTHTQKMITQEEKEHLLTSQTESASGFPLVNIHNDRIVSGMFDMIYDIY